MSTYTPIEPTYADPAAGLTIELTNHPAGNTYDPPDGADWWDCPLCDNRCSIDGLRRHLSREHNLRVVGQRVTLRLGQMFDENGQVIRYTAASSEDVS